MSEESPAFQWYAADYLADGKVQLASSAQEGIYIRLLSYCWRELSIPDNPKVARQFCKPDASIEDVEFVLKTFFIPSKEPGQLIHKRLEEERKKQRKNRKQRAEAGRKSGESRRLKSQHPMNGSSNGRSDVVGTKTNTSTSSSVSTSASEVEEAAEDPRKKPRKPRDVFDPMAMVPPELNTPEFREAWACWIAHRAEIKKPLTPTSARMNIQKCLAIGITRAVAAFSHSIGSRYQGLFEESGSVNRGNGTPASDDPRGNFAARQEFLRVHGIGDEQPDNHQSEE